ncbi:MAG: hypothetical protein LUG57_05305 [Oscillospiraceae bacterium]|nr:hypothetical protein [Oscillospiraceae bacterium]
MTEVTREELGQVRQTLAQHEKTLARRETQYAVINAKLTAILWVLGAVGTAVIAAVVKIVLGV